VESFDEIMYTGMHKLCRNGSDMTIVWFDGTFSNGDVRIQVVFDDNQEVAGLFFL